MFAKQLSVFIENTYGRLCAIIKVLADNSIDIRALSMADTTNYGILRMMVDDPAKAVNILNDAGFAASLTDVIGVSIGDRPGGLYATLETLAKNGISVEYMYAFTEAEPGFAYVVLRIEDTEKAERILTDQGIQILDKSVLTKKTVGEINE